MTDSGNDDPYRRNNELGGYEYDDTEKMLILNIASLLRSRDAGLQKAISGANIVSGAAPRPRDIVAVYTKAAGLLYEMAKKLSAYPAPIGVEQRGVCDWLTVLLGHSFKPADCEQLTMQENAPVTHGVLVDSVSQVLADGIIET